LNSDREALFYALCFSFEGLRSVGIFDPGFGRPIVGRLAFRDGAGFWGRCLGQGGFRRDGPKNGVDNLTGAL